MSYEAVSGKTTFHSPSNLPPLILDQVISFKYLGVPLNCSPYSLLKSFNTQVKQRAQDYLTKVLSLTKSGPSRSDLAYCLWTQIALPSILYGTEILPLNDGTIKEVEKCQYVIAKFILQVPRSTANVTAHLDAGLKPIWAIIAEKVQIYAHNTMSKPTSFWPKLAMTENLMMGSKSPYTRYLIKWKQATHSFAIHPQQIRSSIRHAAISDVLSQQRNYPSTFAMNSPGSLSSKGWFRPKQWVSDSGFSQIYSQFRSCNAGLGNRGPAKNGQFYKLCPLCEKNGLRAINNEVSIIC